MDFLIAKLSVFLKLNRPLLALLVGEILSKKNKIIELKLQSNLSEINRVVTTLENELKVVSCPKDELDHIMISATEAVTNAIRHGNKLDPKKSVFFLLECSENEISISINDQGNGFNPEEIPDPLADENLLNPGGRGVFLMKKLMTKTEILPSKNGTQIKLYKKFNEKK
jgi:serine/threonine-protein kinase RsbW